MSRTTQPCSGPYRVRASLASYGREATVPTQSAYDPTVHLSMADVQVDSTVAPSVVSVTLKASKTDPFREGVTIYMGRTHADVCPVGALLGYIAHRGLAPGPLFHFQDGKYLTRDLLVREIRLALGSIGIDVSAYSGHSFRICDRL